MDEAQRRSPARCVADVWRYRELLVNLTRKELKVKYKNSALGFVWSLLNPLLYLVVFYIVFQLFLPGGLPYFAIFLLAGLLPWTMFSTSFAAGTTSIVANGSLVSKVWFPREILPLASVGAGIIHFGLQSIVLVTAMVVFRYTPGWEYLPLIVPAIITLLVLVAALSIALSAVNVYLRDTQHLLEILLLAWFWMTPIVYPFMRVADRLEDRAWLLLLNPVVPIVITFQRALYNQTTVDNGQTNVLPDASVWWYLRNVGIVFAIACVLLWFAFVLFARLEDNFAEEI